jgi:hypothetical protein
MSADEHRRVTSPIVLYQGGVPVKADRIYTPDDPHAIRMNVFTGGQGRRVDAIA